MILKIVKSVLAFTDFVQTNCRLRSTSMNNKQVIEKKLVHFFVFFSFIVSNSGLCFYRATRIHSADYMPWQDVCLSVRPSVCTSVCLSVTRRY